MLALVFIFPSKMKSVLLFSVCLVLATATPLDKAKSCLDKDCKIEDNCRCSSTSNPQQDSPQLIALTFDEAVVKDGMDNYWQALLFDRKNPDGAPISGTFFVPHEYTDYTQVNKLWTQGFEIGDHSVTKNPLQSYWRNASLDTLVNEFLGQKQIVSTFANIPIEDITGARTPQLQLNGDVTFQAYQKANLTYDNSWPSHPTDPLLPYTLDFASTQKCTAAIRCPTESWPGFWVLPIIDLTGGRECNALTSCEVEGTAQEIADWLIGEIDKLRNGNRAPLSLLINSSWFLFTDNSFDALKLFLDHLATLSDVFLVSQSQVLNWIQNPVALADFKTEVHNRTSTCVDITCKLSFNNDVRYMRSCVECPEVYPWLCDPYGEGKTCNV